MDQEIFFFFGHTEWIKSFTAQLERNAAQFVWKVNERSLLMT